jgi:hypothetical protein
MKSFSYCLFTFVFLVTACTRSGAQDQPDAVTFHISSAHTSFPDTGRAKGHVYDKVLYSAAEHYSDSTVLIIAPKHLDARKQVDLIFWFHGWRNNVDSAAVRYQLTRQFLASKLNAVLVLAETAKDSPDSYGGKLENSGVFKALVGDVISGLRSKHLINKNCSPGHILLAGHSGAYRVMAQIIQNGQVPVDETILFDALYAGTEKFMAWIQADPSHRFIDIYTNHGGTDDETRAMMKLLDVRDVMYVTTEESAVTPQMLQANRLLFIHSLNEHDKIIAHPDNFLLFLENEPFLKKIK